MQVVSDFNLQLSTYFIILSWINYKRKSNKNRKQTIVDDEKETKNERK